MRRNSTICGRAISVPAAKAARRGGRGAPSRTPAGRSRQARATARRRAGGRGAAVRGSPPRISSVQSRATTGASRAAPRPRARTRSRQAATRAGARLAAGDQVVEVEVREEEAGDRPADRRRPGRPRGPSPQARRQPVEGERRQQQVEPEVGVEGPEGGAQEVEQVVRIERRGVEVARQRLPAGPVGVEDREVAVPHRLGLRPLHGEVGVEHVAQDQRLRAAHQRQQAERGGAAAAPRRATATPRAAGPEAGPARPGRPASDPEILRSFGSGFREATEE